MSIQLEDLVARLRLDTSGVGTGLSSLNSSLSSVGDRATAAGRKMTVGITTPIVGLGIASTNLAANFDKTMRQVAIATGGPSEALGKLAKRMGAETAFSAGEAADAMLELAKGGMTAAQIEGGALAATMKLASAGGVELAAASTYVANSMAAFGLKARDADKVTVALAGAANASSASVESLGLGLSQAASSARNAGLSLQETTGVLSLFDSLGLKGSDAGTSLKSMFNGLIPTTDRAREAMAKANLDFVDAEGNFVSVRDMARQLQKGLGGLTEAQRAQTLETIFGSDGQRAASALFRGGAEAVDRYTKASKDQTTTTKLANAAMEGTAGAMERARGSVETAGLAIGQVLAPYVEKAAAKVEELANRFSEASPQTQELIVKGLALAAVVGPLTLGVGVLASSLARVVGVASSVTGGIGKMIGPLAEGETRMTRLAGAAKSAAGVGGMIALTAGLKGAADEGASFGDVMSSAAGGAGVGAMFGPIGALVGAAGGAGLAALTGALADTASEAEAARIELARTAGFKAAEEDADKLSEALRGVVNQYGKTTRAAIEASFTGSDGKLDTDIAKLRELGVSMDTIVSATLGQADAQAIVNGALGRSIEPYQQQYDAAKKAADAERERVQTGATSAAAAQAAAAAMKPYNDRLAEAKNKLDDAKSAADVFTKRVQANTGAIVEHRRQVNDLAGQLGITREQYLKMPKAVRTKVEGDGLPQTISDAMKLIDEYEGLQNFRSIRAVVEATNAQLTTRQIEELTRKYDLTPKQVKTLIATNGIDTESRRVRSYQTELNRTPKNITTTVTTQYVSRGKREQVESLGTNPRQAQRGNGGGGADPYDYGDDAAQQMVDGFTVGLQKRQGQTDKAADDTVDKAGKAAAKRAQELRDRVGKIITDSFAEDIVGGREHVVAAMNRLMDAVEKTQNDRATRLVSKAKATLAPLGRQYEAVAAQLDTARKNLEGLEAARAKVEQRQNALAYGGGDLTMLDLGKDAEGNPIGPTAENVIAALAAVNAAAENFDSNLARLRDAGLSQDALDQLIAKGPEAAAAMAQAILAGGPEAIARIVALQNNIATVGLSIQAKSSQTMYDTGVAAQQGLIAGLESQMELLEAQMTKIAKAMVRAIRKALKIKSPSRVMMGLGEFTGEGFAQGLDSTTRAVAAASDRLASAALVAPPAVTPGVASLAARQAARAVAPSSGTAVRVFIGERELTDIVRVEVGDTLAPAGTYATQGGLS